MACFYSATLAWNPTAVDITAGLARHDIRIVQPAVNGKHFCAGLDMNEHKGRTDPTDAAEVGRRLDEMNFYWCEAPLFDSDIAGLRMLEAMDLPVAAVESVDRGLRTYPQYVGTPNSIWAIGGGIDGISATRKATAFSEACQTKFGKHS